MSDTVLDVAGLGKSFAVPPVDALRDVTFTVARGEFIALTGPSGAGKSTLLALLGGLLTPTTGRVVLAGADLSGLDATALARERCLRVGYVFQFHHLLPELTALENVALPALIAAREGWRPDSPAAIADRARALLDGVGLAGRAEHLPTQLSGGEAQRVAMARALVNEPALVLADEPTGNLDAVTAAGVLDLVSRLHRERNATLLVATHNADVTARSSRMLHLDAGTLDRS